MKQPDYRNDLPRIKNGREYYSVIVAKSASNMEYDNLLKIFISHVKTLHPDDISDAKIYKLVHELYCSLAQHTLKFATNHFLNSTAEISIHGRVLYENDDHTYALVLTQFAPCIETPPHNHPSWVMSTSLYGVETHTFWQRESKEQLLMTPINVKECAPHEVLFVSAETIHSVQNRGTTTAISLQLYGVHPNYGVRSIFNNKRKII